MPTERKVEGDCWYCGKPCYYGDANVAGGTINGGPYGTDRDGESLEWESDIFIHEVPCMKKAFPGKMKALQPQAKAGGTGGKAGPGGSAGGSATTHSDYSPPPNPAVADGERCGRGGCAGPKDHPPKPACAGWPAPAPKAEFPCPKCGKETWYGVCPSCGHDVDAPAPKEERCPGCPHPPHKSGRCSYTYALNGGLCDCLSPAPPKPKKKGGRR